MTVIDSEKLRSLMLRMQATSAELQHANAANAGYCEGTRSATNRYSMELVALIEEQEAAERGRRVLTAAGDIAITLPPPLEGITLQIRNVQCIEDVAITSLCLDCGEQISGEACVRGRCLVCELDKAAGEDTSKRRDEAQL